MDTNEFIIRAKKVHGDKYDYSRVNYINAKTKVCIICPIHGEFWQTPDSHLRTNGCIKCRYEKQGKKQVSTDEAFITKAKRIHGDRYDYSKVEYVNNKTKVCIICPEHGEFWQTPMSHLQGRGCNECAKENIKKKLSSNTEEFISKAKEIHGDRYDYSKVKYVNGGTKVCIICHIHGEFWQTPNHHLKGEGCPKCRYERNSQIQKMSTEEFIEKARSVHGDKYDYSKVIYDGYENYVTIGCPIHGYYLQTPDSHLHSGGCFKCGVTNSKAEAEIIDYLKSIDENIIIKERDRTVLEKKEIDILLPEYNLGIEYNGLLWHCDKLKKDKNYHLSKTLECNEKGIKLIQIFEDEYVKHKDIVLAKILHIIKRGKYNRKIGGRECIIKLINNKDAKDFLEKNHIQGFIKSSVYIGAFWKDELVGVMSFTKEHKNSDNWELTRYASKIDYCCIGVGGKLFKYFIRCYKPNSVKSFADRRWTLDETDNIYVKLGFKLDKILPPDYYYYNEKINKYDRIHKFNFRKAKLNKKYGIDIAMTEANMAEVLGYSKIWNCGLYKFKWENKNNI